MKASRTPAQMASIHDLQLFLSGKELLKTEIPIEWHPLLDNHDQVYRIPGIKNGCCARCGNSDPDLFATFPHSVCGKDCLYCRKCMMMGRISACTDLYGWSDPPVQWDSGHVILQWKGELSPSQEKAAEAIIQAVQEPGELLIWAVCGAGKTEMIFKAIEEALQSQKRVCIASPRTDVILELTPRLKSVFPQITIASLYGDSEDKAIFAPLVLSTTHQLMRYTNAFDVIIIDEVDAFPFSYEESLQFAAQKACTQNASIIYLTATPSKDWQHQFISGQRKGVLLPARFHGYSIPEPRLKWIGNWRKAIHKGKLSPPLHDWLQKAIQSGRPYLLFFPTIDLMEKSLPIFQTYTDKIKSVHAEDPQRKQKIIELRNGEIQGLLTTTILERGVTIPKLNAAVIGAEERIFSESALVQIAGRVGRHKDFPTGDIVFFHYGRTDAMLDAIHQIRQMNQEAAKRGLLK